MTISICVVDDCRSSASVLELLSVKFVTEDGYTVKITHHTEGTTLLNELRNGVVYDCIVLDVHMPVINGPELFQELVKLHCEAVIIYYSAVLSKCEGRNCMISKCSTQPLVEIVEAYNMLRHDHLGNMLKMAIRTSELQKRLQCQT